MESGVIDLDKIQAEAVAADRAKLRAAAKAKAKPKAKKRSKVTFRVDLDEDEAELRIGHEGKDGDVEFGFKVKGSGLTDLFDGGGGLEGMTEVGKFTPKRG